MSFKNADILGWYEIKTTNSGVEQTAETSPESLSLLSVDVKAAAQWFQQVLKLHTL